MTEWKEYNGSDEQIAEILQHTDGLITEDNVIVDCDKNLLIHDILAIGDKYFLCNPHPLADMICQQARTGQPVWIRVLIDNVAPERFSNMYKLWGPTTTPDWNIPNAEYSFTVFKGEV